MTLPESGVIAPRIYLAIVVLPEPDSPAITSTSLLCRENETSSTAFTTDVFEPNIFFLENCLDNPSTLRISSNKLLLAD